MKMILFQLAIGVLVISIIFIGVRLIFTYANEDENKQQHVTESQMMIKESFLINELKVGQVFRLSELIDSPGATVCVLTPYIELTNEDITRKNIINKYLEKVGYDINDDSHWAIIIANNQDVNLSMFKRSQTLDAYSVFEVERQKLQTGIKPMVCTVLEKAAIVKTRSQNQVRITFGEVE